MHLFQHHHVPLETVGQPGCLVVHPQLQPVVQDGLVHTSQLVPHSSPPDVARWKDKQVTHGMEGVKQSGHHTQLPVSHAPPVLLVNRKYS